MSLARKLLLTVASAVLAAAGLLMVMALANGGFDMRGSIAARPNGWVLPLVTGVLIAGVCAVLLRAFERRAEREDMPPQEDCPFCQRPVHVGWRLCPYCGQMLSCPTRSVDGDGSDLVDVDGEGV